MTSWPQEPQLKNPKQFQGGNMQRVAQTFSTKFEVSISLAGGRQSGPKSKLFFFCSSSLRIAKLQLSEPDRVEITPNSLQKKENVMIFSMF
jgi:hypothetical protein